MANDEVLGPRKTMFVLVIVVGCFAVLWPRILSPLILGNSQEQLKPNQFDREAGLKQERSPIRGMGPHPALRERGRAIPPGVPTPQAPPRAPVTLPPHIRVRTSPLSVYYESEHDIKPPPIPGMRPPLGSPGGPVAGPKSSMGFVMPIYTICIIVFFVYTLSKILFKRTCCPYDSVTPDPQFRRRVFRDDSRPTPDKLVVTAISGLVAEVQQQMEASDVQSQQRQDAQDNARPYTNGTILLNSGPVQIIASEFQESKEKVSESKKEIASPRPKESTPEINEPATEIESKESDSAESNIDNYNKTGISDDLLTEQNSEHKEAVLETSVLEPIKSSHEIIVPLEDQEASKEVSRELEQFAAEQTQKEIETEDNDRLEDLELARQQEEPNPDPALEKVPKVSDENTNRANVNLALSDALSDALDLNKDDTLAKTTEQLIKEERGEANEVNKEKQSTPELLEEALKEDLPTDQEDGDIESSSVKVLGMVVTTHAADGGELPRPLLPPVASQPAQPHRPHEAEDVRSIYLETEIPQQARVLVAEFAENRADRPKPTKNAPLVVSGKMTLSLIQDAPRETPDRDPESTVDDFTTASAMTQAADEKEEDLSDEEIEEEIEIEEIEEEIEEEEEEGDELNNEPETDVKIVK